MKDCYARARHHPPDVVAGAGPHQGLHRDAAAQRLPVAAHVGDQRARLSVRGADPHRGDAPARRGRHRRALEVQGRAASAPAATSSTSSGCASCSNGSRRCATRRSSSHNLKIDLYPEEVYTLHAARPGEGAAARRDAGRLRLRDPHRRRPSLRRRARQRPHGAAAHAAQERRHRRDRHQRRATSRAATG